MESAPAGVISPARRVAPSTVVFVAVTAAAIAFLLWQGRDLTFFWDEWSWIYNRADWTFGALMDPYNEHWSLVPMLIYKLLLSTVGLRTYLPYLAVLLLLHATVVAAVFTLVRRRIGPLVALAMAAILLLFGAGYENLLWASGITYLSAAAPGVWALVLVLLDPARHPRLVAGLLVVSVAAGGIGLFFLAAVTVALAVTPEGRRRLWAVLPAMAIYAVWFLILGRNAIRAPFTLASFEGLPRYLGLGVGAAAKSVFGFGRLAAVAALGAVAIGAVLALRHRAARPGILAAAAGLVTEFVLIGLTRGADEFGLSRYQYVAAVFLLILIASVLADLHLPDRAVAVPVAIVAVISLANGLPVLEAQRDWYFARADTTRALVSLQLQYGGSPAIPENVSMGGPGLPHGLLAAGSPQGARDVVNWFGSPLTDALYGTMPISNAALDGVLFQIVQHDIQVRDVGKAPPSGGVAVQVDHALNATLTPGAGGCVTAAPTAAGAQLFLAVSGGRELVLQPQAGGTARLFLTRHGTFPDLFEMNYDVMPDYVQVPLTAGVATSASIPDIGDPVPWQARLDLPGGGVTVVCETAPTGP